jgi:hypothetical protein
VLCCVVAERLDLPLVPPFLAHGHGDGSLRRGTNFAVGSATAVNASFFHHDGEAPDLLFPINVSLSVQLQWFESLKPSLCATPKGESPLFVSLNLMMNRGTDGRRSAAECQEFLGSSLFLVGELGYNDYSSSLARSKSVQQARSLVPDIVGTISTAIEVITTPSTSQLLHTQDHHHTNVT